VQPPPTFAAVSKRSSSAHFGGGRLSQLKVSVGPGKPNLKPDVLLVQKLLNNNSSRLQAEPLKLDGVFGPKTAADILAYQALVLGMRRPDGVIDPGERTIRSLMRGGESQGSSAGRAAAVVGLATSRGQHLRPSEVQSFIDFALPAAKKVKREWRVPISLLLAHSGLTTGWGKHVTANAYFGIQGKRQSADMRNFAGFEVVEGKRLRIKSVFRAYNDFADSADDFARFLCETPRYQRAFSDLHDPLRFAETVSSIWSADHPQTASLVTRIIRSYRLDEYDR
jgi:hypothetical protein